MDSPEAEPEVRIHGKGLVGDMLPEEVYKGTGLGLRGAGTGEGRARGQTGCNLSLLLWGLWSISHTSELFPAGDKGWALLLRLQLVTG